MASGEFTSAPGGPAASGEVPAGNGLAPGGDPPPGGRLASGGSAPARSGRPGAVAAAVVVAVLLLAGVTGIVLLNRKDADGGRGATGQPTASASHDDAPASRRYATAVLPEELCTKVTLGKLGTTYNRSDTTPTNTRAGDGSTNYATCTMYRRGKTRDELSISVTAVVHANIAQAVWSQQVIFDDARSVDADMMVLTGIGEEAFAARTLPTSTAWTMTYTAEARDGNLRISVVGMADPGSPSDEEIRQFGRDLADVAKSLIATLGSG
jgi:hypothetical protein